VQREDKRQGLITSNIRTKSKRGGKRAGAGRPRSEDSIRGQLAAAAEAAAANQKWNHTYTRWEVVREGYVSKYACRLVSVLSYYRDPTSRDPEKKLLSAYQAYKIAHASWAEQLEILKRDYREVLLKGTEAFKEFEMDIKSTSAYRSTGAWALKQCTTLLAQRAKPAKRKFESVQ
jgi:hypothetical protein